MLLYFFEEEDDPDQAARVDEEEEMIVAAAPTAEDTAEVDITPAVIPIQNLHPKSIFQDTFLKHIYSSRKDTIK
jgi:hypothetical protein